MLRAIRSTRNSPQRWKRSGCFSRFLLHRNSLRDRLTHPPRHTRPDTQAPKADKLLPFDQFPGRSSAKRRHAYQHSDKPIHAHAQAHIQGTYTREPLKHIPDRWYGCATVVCRLCKMRAPSGLPHRNSRRCVRRPRWLCACVVTVLLWAPSLIFGVLYPKGPLFPAGDRAPRRQETGSKDEAWSTDEGIGKAGAVRLCSRDRSISGDGEMGRRLFV